jgi:hypothetical protein
MRKSLAILGVLYLIGAAINLPFATHLLKSRLSSPRRATIDLRGAEASTRDYPAPTPHSKPWQPPDYWSEYDDFGYRKITAGFFLEPAHNDLQMQFELTGWPLPVFERVHCWWPSQDPNWATPAEPDPAMRLHWPGVLLNPLIFAVTAWFLCFAIPAACRAAVRASRRRRRRCEACGYPAGTSGRCSECGTAITRTGTTSPAASAPSANP